MHSRFPICVVLIAGCALLTIAAQPAAAKIVYTPVNTTLTGGGHIKIDLNHDGIKDFDIQAAVSGVYCGVGSGGIHGVVTVTPRTGDGVVANGTSAADLSSGVTVGPAGTYSNSQSLMTNFLLSRGCGAHGNSWCYLRTPYTCSGGGYLGLRFLLNGQTHYGWAYVSITGSIWNGLSVTLQSFAYETVAGHGLTTGQTSGT